MKKRNSSIELLKLAAILLIVINHVVQTLGTAPNAFVPFYGYNMNLASATTGEKRLLLSMLCYSGNLGNTLFVVCSAWFLLDSKIVRKKKILIMLADVWTISVCILGVVLILRNGDLNSGLILRSLFPNTCSNNWYITCYILFYAIHPILNKIIFSMDQKALFRMNRSPSSRQRKK